MTTVLTDYVFPVNTFDRCHESPYLMTQKATTSTDSHWKNP